MNPDAMIIDDVIRMIVCSLALNPTQSSCNVSTRNEYNTRFLNTLNEWLRFFDAHVAYFHVEGLSQCEVFVPLNSWGFC
jgi:hypothetical protein